MHELPALQHVHRSSVIDLHHTIAPPLSRIPVDAQKLISVARPTEGTRFFVLAPGDMLLHSALHLLQEGDFSHGMRDLLDIDALLREFGSEFELLAFLARACARAWPNAATLLRGRSGAELTRDATTADISERDRAPPAALSYAADHGITPRWRVAIVRNLAWASLHARTLHAHATSPPHPTSRAQSGNSIGLLHDPSKPIDKRRPGNRKVREK